MKLLAIAVSLAALAAWGGTAGAADDGSKTPTPTAQPDGTVTITPEGPQPKDALAGPPASDEAKAADEAADDEKPPAFGMPGALPQAEDMLLMACWAAGKTEEAGPQMDPLKVLEQVIENMGKTEELLSQQRVAGDETVQVETKVIEDLSALVEYVKQKQQKQDKKPKPKPKPSSGDSKSAGSSAPKPGTGKGEPKTTRSKNPASKEQATHGAADENGLKGDNPDRDMERWGLLPENAPQETKQAMSEMILPQYRELLNRYFYALAQHKDEADGGK